MNRNISHQKSNPTHIPYQSEPLPMKFPISLDESFQIPPVTDSLKLERTMTPRPPEEMDTAKLFSVQPTTRLDLPLTPPPSNVELTASARSVPATATEANSGRKKKIYTMQSLPYWGAPPAVAQVKIPELVPGTSLQNNRYTLQKVTHRHLWPFDIIENIWSALDTHADGIPAVIYELHIPRRAPQEVQTIPQIAEQILTAIGSHPHMLALREVFSEQRRTFFVFEPIYGLTLSALIRRNGGRMDERDVITCCMQIADALNACSRQQYPVIHGNIQADVILKRPGTSEYVLTNFSLALIGGLAQFLTHEEMTSLEAYNATGVLDAPGDLFTLLTLAYFAQTGERFSDLYTLVRHTAFSDRWEALLVKALATNSYQRYQRASELFRDLSILHQQDVQRSGRQRSTTAENHFSSLQSSSYVNGREKISY